MSLLAGGKYMKNHAAYAPLGGVLTLLVVALPVLCGCRAGAGSSAGSNVSVMRLAEPPDSTLFSADQLVVEDTVRAWPMSQVNRAERWAVHPESAHHGIDRFGLWLMPGAENDQQHSMTGRVSFQADEVSIIEVTFKDAAQVASWLYWAEPGARFSQSRRVRVWKVERKGGSVRVVRFRVDDHPEWRGKIGRLRLEPARGTRTRFCVVSVMAIQAQVDLERVAVARQRAWKLDLGHTIRSSMIAFPGQTWVAQVTVPKQGARLRFVPGLPHRASDPVRFIVTAAQPGSKETILLSEELLADDSSGPSWREMIEVPLDPFSGNDVQLSFKVEGIHSISSNDGLAAWGNPQIIGGDDGQESRPSIVLICLDTLRADHVSTYGYARKTTPRIDEWAARRAVVFETAVAPSPWTLPSHISMFSGIDAIRHGSNFHHPASDELEMVAEMLASGGYETVAWTGGGYLGSGYALHQGFESFTYWLGRKEDEVVENFDRAIDWLRTDHDRPFFMFLHSYEVHEPYFERQPFYDQFAKASGRPPIPSDWVATRKQDRHAENGFLGHKKLAMSPDRGKTWQAIPPELEESVIDRYDAGIAFTDAQVGRLLDELEALGRSQDTVVVVTSDHGEGLGEHGLAGHAYLYDFNILVPLIVAAPGSGWPQGERVSQQVRSIDITPTLLELAGLDTPDDIDGSSLAALVDGQDPAGDRPGWSYAASTNRGIALRAPDSKYIFNNTAWSPAFGTERLYDLRRDPDEETSLISSRQSEVEALRALVEARVAEVMTGLWISVESNLGSPLVVELSGKDVASPPQLKALTMPGGGARYRVDESQVAVIELPSEAEAKLYSEANAQARIELKVPESVAGPAASWRLQVADIRNEGGWQAWLANDRWAVGSPPEHDVDVLISLRTSGGIAEGGAAAPMTDEVREQLKALGYIE